MDSAGRRAMLRVRLTPKGGRDALRLWEAEVLHVRVAAPPVDGAANRALVALLSKALGIAKSRISITGGETSRDKLLQVDGILAEELSCRIEKSLK